MEVEGLRSQGFPVAVSAELEIRLRRIASIMDLWSAKYAAVGSIVAITVDTGDGLVGFVFLR